MDSTVVSFQHDQEHDDVSALFISRVSMMDDSSGRSGSFGMGKSMERVLIFEASPMVLVFSEPTWLFPRAATFSARPLLQWIQRLSAILLYSTLPTVENAMHRAKLPKCFIVASQRGKACMHGKAKGMNLVNFFRLSPRSHPLTCRLFLKGVGVEILKR